MIQKRGKKLALVGRRLSGNENLGLGYLTTALIRAGYEVHVEYINRGVDLQRIAEIITGDQFFMVGVSLSDGGSSFLPLALGELLRRHGYSGHITAGGHFATLADEWLLERYPWLDSVVRFAGEVPIVDLAESVYAGKSISSLPGVRTRRGPGLPAPVLDNTPMKLWPTRDVKPEILGYGVAQVSATRGCKGRCTYCGPAAIQSREKSEARAAGASSWDIRNCGVGGVRRRDLADVCDEMATLWHEHGVRYFYLVDEHLLPYDERGALDYLDTWHRGLEKRRVGPFGLGLMLRAERINEAIIERFKQVGLVRCFVGLELATEAEGEKFGRKIDPEHNIRLLESFNRLGVETVSNLMLVHPYSTLDTVSSGLQYLKRIRPGLFETTRMMPYHGTRLATRLRREGRLDGNPLRYGYGFADPRMMRFVQIFARLRAQAFRDYSLAYYAHDVFVSLALARHLYPEKPLNALGARIENLRYQINQTYIQSYEAALALARDGGDQDCEDRLVVDTMEQVRAVQAELAQVDARLNIVLQDSVRRYSPLASAAAAVFAFSIMGSSLGGCYQSQGKERDDDAGPVESDLSTDSDTEKDTELDTAVDTEWSTEIDTAMEPDSATTDDDTCQGEKETEQKNALVQNTEDQVPCFDGYLRFEASGKIVAEATTRRGFMRICQEEDLEVLEAEAENAALETESDCVTGAVYVEGELGNDLRKLSEGADRDCNMWQVGPHDFVIHLDAEGFVSKVTTNSDDPSLAETAKCVLSALKGLQFPCLANFDVCPEYLIAE